MSDPSLSAQIEALLFVSSEPLTARQLAQALERPVAEIEAGLRRLAEELTGRGIRLQAHRGRWQLTTAPEVAPWVERLLGLEAGGGRLSRAALETLAIVAYRQPISRPQIDDIRGVNSDGVLRTLLSKGLIEEVGRAEGPGRPVLYGTTELFLQVFGLGSLEALPPLPIEEAQGPDTPEPDALLKS